jgi:outer membrane receptor protein involved in Fe transport
MDNVSFINDLKLRASYGVLGNNEVGGDYPGFSNFGTGVDVSNYDLNGTGNRTVTGFEQSSTGNPLLKWESTAVTNIGFDAVLAGGWNVMLEWYKRDTRDMIYNVELPLELGAVGRQAQNIGQMTNTGFDFALGYSKRVNRDFNFNVNVTGSTVKNEVVKLEANSNTFIRSGLVISLIPRLVCLSLSSMVMYRKVSGNQMLTLLRYFSPTKVMPRWVASVMLT